mgnify:CR=1 FL=1
MRRHRIYTADKKVRDSYKAHRKALGGVWDSKTARTPSCMYKAGIRLWFPVFRGRGSNRRAILFIPYMCNWSPGCGLNPIIKGDPHEYSWVQPIDEVIL